MRRGPQDYISASRYKPQVHAGYGVAMYLFQHAYNDVSNLRLEQRSATDDREELFWSDVGVEVVMTSLKMLGRGLTRLKRNRTRSFKMRKHGLKHMTEHFDR
jgi:hypothetical protein